EADDSTELWRCETKILIRIKVSHTFTSWKKSQCNLPEFPTSTTVRTKSISVTIKTKSESFARRSIIDPESSIPDVILVLEGQKFSVNKQVLSSQSSYFNKLFFGNFKESKQEEIEIKDTDPQLFHELLKMMYGVSKEPTTVENAIRFLMMADIFDLQIVKDRMENFLLSTDLISIHRKILIAEDHRLEILKKEVLLLYKNKENLMALKKSPEYAIFDKFPESVKNVLIGYALELL
ncbi:hypothetical protein PENTCL1PPCAC_13138, partial [Pristionchus entomophagus]